MTPYDCPSQKGILPSVSITMCMVSPVALGPTMRSTDLTLACWIRRECEGGKKEEEVSEPKGRAKTLAERGKKNRSSLGPEALTLSRAKRKKLQFYLEGRLVVEGVEGHLSLLELERDLLADDLEWEKGGKKRA